MIYIYDLYSGDTIWRFVISLVNGLFTYDQLDIQHYDEYGWIDDGYVATKYGEYAFLTGFNMLDLVTVNMLKYWYNCEWDVYENLNMRYDCDHHNKV